jgi:hypothetical protein
VNGLLFNCFKIFAHTKTLLTKSKTSKFYKPIFPESEIAAIYNESAGSSLPSQRSILRKETLNKRGLTALGSDWDEIDKVFMSFIEEKMRVNDTLQESSKSAFQDLKRKARFEKLTAISRKNLIHFKPGELQVVIEGILKRRQLERKANENIG